MHGEALSTEEIYRSIADGHLDEAETHRLIELVTTVQRNASSIIEVLVRNKARLRGEAVNRRDAQGTPTTPRLRKV